MRTIIGREPGHALLCAGMKSSQPFRARFAALPGTLRGAAWMCLAAIGLAGIIGMVRYLSARLHPIEIVFFRNLFGFAAMVPWMVKMGAAAYRTKGKKMHLLRAALSWVGMTSWFLAISLIPLAEAVALSFTAPLWATIGAALILKEEVRTRRWIAVTIGFIGVLIILRPGADTLSPAAGIALLSAAAVAASTLVIKQLSRRDSPETIVVHLGIFLTPMSLVPALFVWTTPTDPGTWAWLLLMGVVGSLSHIALGRSLAAAEASAVVPYDFLRLPVVSLIGYVAFGETTDAMTWVGAAIILGSSAYIAHRESRLGRATATAAAVPARADIALPPRETPPAERGSHDGSGG